VRTSAHGVRAKTAGRRGGGRTQEIAGARRQSRWDALYETYAEDDPGGDPSDPVFGIGAAAWTDSETGLPPEAAILHVEED
jgi:hypothetical protein